MSINLIAGKAQAGEGAFFHDFADRAGFLVAVCRAMKRADIAKTPEDARPDTGFVLGRCGRDYRCVVDRHFRSGACWGAWAREV
jgi:hypothetical protein